MIDVVLFSEKFYLDLRGVAMHFTLGLIGPIYGLDLNFRFILGNKGLNEE